MQFLKLFFGFPSDRRQHLIDISAVGVFADTVILLIVLCKNPPAFDRIIYYSNSPMKVDQFVSALPHMLFSLHEVGWGLVGLGAGWL